MQSDPPPTESRAHSWRLYLSDQVMAFVAILAVLITIAPATFTLSSEWKTALTMADVVILLIFALEYALGWRLAADKAQYVRDPWRIVDVIVIVALAISLLPLPTDALGLTPILRLARLARLAVLGTRSGMRLSTRLSGTGLPAPRTQHSLVAMALDLAEREPSFHQITWDDALERIESQQDDWLFVSGIVAQRLGPVAKGLAINETVLRNKLFESTFPRFDRLERYATLFTWYPEVEATDDGDLRVQRTGLLLVGSANNVIVLARGETDLISRLERRIAQADPGASGLVKATYALIKEVIGAYQRVAEHLETRLIRIETTESSLRDREFLAETFKVRQEISRVRTTVRHLVAVTRNLNSRRVPIRGFDSAELPQFQLLAGETADLYERIDDLHQTLGALVDMRLNVSSFQMNKVMRLLAILTTLALIPSVVGGMLGMNTMDTPWPISLPQVGFWVGAGMLFSMYLFAIKGWFK